MLKKVCEEIVIKIKEYSEISDKFIIEEFNKEIFDFHQWVDGKRILGIFLITSKESNEKYYFIFIDWKETGEYYLVICPEKRTGPLVEIHKKDDNFDLVWKYSPSKRDGKNNERKEYFEKFYGALETRIRIPLYIDEVEGFIYDVIDLVIKRCKADILDEETPMKRDEFPEGRTYEALHRKRERNSQLISLVKKTKKAKYGHLSCEICGFNFKEKYGDIGEDFIEAHHAIPVSELNEDSTTKVEDIALLCSNCHSILHRKRPWLKISELKNLLK